MLPLRVVADMQLAPVQKSSTLSWCTQGYWMLPSWWTGWHGVPELQCAAVQVLLTGLCLCSTAQARLPTSAGCF